MICGLALTNAILLLRIPPLGWNHRTMRQGSMALYHKDRLISAAGFPPLRPRARMARGLSLVLIGLAAAATWAVVYALIELVFYAFG
mgnify:CR=1 FL=1